MPEINLGASEEVELDLTELYERVEQIAIDENTNGTPEEPAPEAEE